ncbi:MAG TPA: pyrimidine 5'-nucleotidase, partial [Alphaproteobacteria bacterium]|nr:pyrimidine 5'-nucleotidase [Alphaproteobacteria bacterium]
MTADTKPAALDHVDAWVFDLDNTLYPASCNLFEQVDRRMGEFICRYLDLGWDDARDLQKRYFREHGTTLRGLMTVHDLDPEEYLDFVHDIDLTPVDHSHVLDDALSRLGGRKLIFTNGSVRHAERVLEKIGIARHFEDIADIVACGYVPKPDRSIYEKVIDRFGIDPRRSAMIEDMARNLKPAHELGMTTVWVRTDEDWASVPPDAAYVDHAIDDLGEWLL